MVGMYLNFQHLAAGDATVMHFVVGVIGIAPALIFDKGETVEVSK